MIFQSLAASQLGLVQEVASWRTSVGDQFFIFWNFFDQTPFYLLLIPLVLIFASPKAGRDFVLLILISATLNPLLKSWTQVPRPLTLDPSLFLVHVGGTSFPSGAAQSAFLIFYCAYKYERRALNLALVALFSLTLSFSRVYLGVHYPMDLLGGWLVGGLIALAYERLLCPMLERYPHFFDRALEWSVVPFLCLTFFYSRTISVLPLIGALLYVQGAYSYVARDLALQQRGAEDPRSLSEAKSSTWPLLALSAIILPALLLISYPHQSYAQIYYIAFMLLFMLFGKKWRALVMEPQ